MSKLIRRAVAALSCASVTRSSSSGVINRSAVKLSSIVSASRLYAMVVTTRSGAAPLDTKWRQYCSNGRVLPVPLPNSDLAGMLNWYTSPDSSPSKNNATLRLKRQALPLPFLPEPSMFLGQLAQLADWRLDADASGLSPRLEKQSGAVPLASGS